MNNNNDIFNPVHVSKRMQQWEIDLHRKKLYPFLLMATDDKGQTTVLSIVNHKLTRDYLEQMLKAMDAGKPVIVLGK